jgi:hypothetical protein
MAFALESGGKTAALHERRAAKNGCPTKTKSPLQKAGAYKGRGQVFEAPGEQECLCCLVDLDLGAGGGAG